jgi:hypothetical protein
MSLEFFGLAGITASACRRRVAAPLNVAPPHTAVRTVRPGDDASPQHREMPPSPCGLIRLMDTPA